jgi:predicted secreted protein
MAVYRGLDGEVVIGSDTVGESTSFTITQTGDTIDTTAQRATGDARTYLAGLNTFTGSVEAHFDNDDTAQTAVVIGAELSFTFYPAGDTAGRQAISGTGIITNIETASQFDNQAVSFNFQFQGTGELTKTTIT